jgi:hypothetical protein
MTRVVFVGSLDERQASFRTVAANLKCLVIRLAEKQCAFLVRGVLRPKGTRLPVDYLVIEALAQYVKQNSGCRLDLIVVLEPGVFFNSIPFEYATHHASSSVRKLFYKEILDKVQVAVAVGGATGVARFMMTADWLGKPYLILPGSGGASDYLWRDYFVEASHIKSIDPKLVERLHQTPLISSERPSYAEITSEEILALAATPMPPRSEPSAPIGYDPEALTLDRVLTLAKRFSFGFWAFLLGMAGILITLGFYLCKLLGN